VRPLGWSVAVLLVLVAQVAPAQDAPGDGMPLLSPVTWERLLNSDDEPHSWLMYHGALHGQRFSRLDQINRENVGRLELKWAHQIRQLDRNQTTPLVVDGVMFITESPSNVTAVDAATGRAYWRYEHPLPDGIRLCCGRNNRGVAILGETLYMSTNDAHLVAIDARSGSLLWETELADHTKGYSKTAAPLVVGDTVVTGIAGGEFGIRGFIDGYDTATGELRWRTYTVPGPGEPGNESWAGDSWRTGGAPTWLTGVYDPELDLIYWGTGNPAPDWNGDLRLGDNLYSSSVLALDRETGRIVWHFQFTPHDAWDWDAIQVPVLADLELNGELRKTMLWANRNAFYYLLDRESGQFLLGEPFALQTWAHGLDENGRPILRENVYPTTEGTRVAPIAGGATNWWSPAFSPRTGFLYVNSFDAEGIYYQRDDEYEEGSTFLGGGHRMPLAADHYKSAIRAIEATTGEIRWEFPITPRTRSGVLATAGGLVWSASVDGYFFALDEETGEPLWRMSLGAAPHASPMSYAVGGEQRIVVAMGNVVFVFGLTEK